MGDSIYPLGQVANLDVQLIDRTIQDAFEDGSTSSRRLWSTSCFKRKFTLTHAPLSETSFRFIQSFFSQRSGQYDSFWIRDNVHRSGNAHVRLAKPFRINKGGSHIYDVTLELEEIAPKQLLPDWDELSTAIGSNAFAFYDPNRVVTYIDQNTQYGDSSLLNRSLFGTPSTYNLREQAVSPTYIDLGLSTNLDYNYLTYSNNQWRKTSAVVAQSAQPAFTIAGFFKQSACASKQVLLSIGDTGTGKALGIVLASDNRYEPWVGGAEAWTNARYNNSAASTWRSVAVTWPSASNDASLYVNGALIGTDTVTRSYVSGFLAAGASGTGTLKCGCTTDNHGQLMMVSSELGLSNIKGFHNLFAYQYGLATV